MSRPASVVKVGQERGREGVLGRALGAGGEGAGEGASKQAGHLIPDPHICPVQVRLGLQRPLLDGLLERLAERHRGSWGSGGGSARASGRPGRALTLSRWESTCTWPAAGHACTAV